LDLYYCWDSRLNNPLLNSIYRQETSYVERWFLQSQYLLNQEELDHPIMKQLLTKEDNTLSLLIDVTEKDLAVQRYFSDVINYDSVTVNVNKLNRWMAKWQCLQQYRQRR
jgi:hypothetical protein